MKSPKEIVKSCRDVVKNLSNINILYFFGNGRNQGKILCAYGDSITYQARWYKPVIQAQGLKYIINKGVPGATITGVNGLNTDKNLKRLANCQSDAIMIMGGSMILSVAETLARLIL